MRIASLVASGVASWASVSSTSQLWGQTVAHVERGKVALTFDDGPNGDTTLRLLEVLEREQAKATFFVVGRFVRGQESVLREIAKAGHTLGNHTWAHPNLFWCSGERTREELRRCSEAVEDVAGIGVKLFRPPYGFRRPDTLKVVREMGMIPVLWNVKCWDWRKTSEESVSGYIRRGLARNGRRGRGAVVLLHDGGDKGVGADRMHTVKAVRRLLMERRDLEYVAL